MTEAIDSKITAVTEIMTQTIIKKSKISCKRPLVSVGLTKAYNFWRKVLFLLASLNSLYAGITTRNNLNKRSSLNPLSILRSISTKALK